MRVCVIGAGPCGLACCKLLLDQPEIQTVVVYEQAEQLGGQWLYTDCVGTDHRGRKVHSSIYKDLITNFPKELQTFPGWSYADRIPEGTFLESAEVLKYLEGYADKFNLRHRIRTNTVVEVVTPREADGKVIWEVQTTDLAQQPPKSDHHSFDAVFVCAGKDAVPYSPHIPGLDTFPGQVIHSHDFKVPEPFQNKTVLCLGAGFSGLDLSIILKDVAKHVYLCKNESAWISLPSVDTRPTISAISGPTITLTDGQTLTDVDTIIVCTGYDYHFPFLSDECKVKVEHGHITPLYKHIIHPHWRSTLMFVSIVSGSIGFRHLYLEAGFAVAALLKKFPLPSEQEMLEDIERDYKQRKEMGVPDYKSHTMLPYVQLLLQFHKDLKSLAGDHVTDIPPTFLAVMEPMMKRCIEDFESYRTAVYPGLLPPDA